jgi:hypothetical protein
VHYWKLVDEVQAPCLPRCLPFLLPTVPVQHNTPSCHPSPYIKQIHTLCTPTLYPPPQPDEEDRIVAVNEWLSMAKAVHGSCTDTHLSDLKFLSLTVTA